MRYDGISLKINRLEEITFLPQISLKQLDDISLHTKAARELIFLTTFSIRSYRTKPKQKYKLHPVYRSHN